MRLMRLALRNFKGARDVVVEPLGADLDVYGDNATGKTTLADACSWLLIGKDSQGRADFDIKTLGGDGVALSKLEHTVEAEIDVDGARLTLRKTYKEKHETKRGSAAELFTGHVTEHYVNTVPVTKTEYEARVAQVCPPRRLRLLSDPAWFVLGMPWQERRAILLDVCGDLTDADVIRSDGALSALPRILGPHSLEEYRKILASRSKALKPQRDEIPARIDQEHRGLPEPVPGNWEAVREAARSRLSEAQAFRATISSGGAMAAKTTRLQEIKGALLAIENRLRSQPNPAREAALSKARTLDAAMRANGDNLASLSRRISGGESDLAALNLDRNALLAEFKEIAEERQQGDDVCPACGQALPEERRQTAVESFNASKARRQSAIQEKGKPVRRRIDALAAEIEAWGEQRARTEADLANARAARADLTIPDEETPDPSSDPEHIRLCEERTAVEAEIAELRADSTVALADADAQIAEARAHVEEATGHILAAKQRAGGIERIADLEAREKALAEEAERIERETYLCEAFVRAKVSLLTGRINSRFGLVSFRLFEDQINEGLRECCVATVGGVPIGTGLNHAAEVNAGLEAIDVLAGHYGIDVPVFVDNAESVTSVRPTRGQQVRLVVSAADPVLRFETSGAPVATTPEGALF